VPAHTSDDGLWLVAFLWRKLMTEINIRHYRSKPTEVQAVLWTGDPDQGQLLKEQGWIADMDRGFSKDKSGEVVLRAHCKSLQGTVIAFPGDYIIKKSADDVYPCDPVVFDERWEHIPDYMDLLITDGQDPEPPRNPIPTGENPDAVNLEPERELGEDPGEFDTEEDIDPEFLAGGGEPALLQVDVRDDDADVFADDDEEEEEEEDEDGE
jgi:hypothetical protein